VLGLLLAGCDPVDATSGAAEVAAHTANPPATASARPSSGRTSTGRCPAPGPGISKVLPTLSSAGMRTVSTNPCVPFAGLVSDVMGIVTTQDPQKHDFRPYLTKFVDKIAQADDLATCAYETDNLGIRIYQQEKHSWSVGLVVVFRADIKAPAEIGLCYLEKSLGFRSESTRSPRFDPCWRATQVTRGGDTFTMLWAGSSDVFCTAMATATK
jgi:hypothetical protein